MKTFTTICMLSLLIFFSVGCGTNSVLTALNTVVITSEAVLPFLGPSVGLPPASIQLIETYLAAVSDAVTQAGPILSSTESAAEKAAQIVGLFAGIAQPNLPAGTAQSVVNVIQNVVRAVELFLKNFQPAPVAAASRASKPLTLSSSDMSQLAKIEQRNAAFKASLASLAALGK